MSTAHQNQLPGNTLVYASRKFQQISTIHSLPYCRIVTMSALRCDSYVRLCICAWHAQTDHFVGSMRSTRGCRTTTAVDVHATILCLLPDNAKRKRSSPAACHTSC